MTAAVSDISFSQWYQTGQTVRGEYITNITVPDSNTAWISWMNPDFSSNILRTTNGGANWNFVTPPGNGYFLTTSQGLSPLKAVIGMGESNPEIWMTEDGGLNWYFIDQIAGINSYIDDIVFSKSNPDIGFIVGDEGTTNHIFKTTDGGTVWSRSSHDNQGQYPAFQSGFAIDQSFFGFRIYLSGSLTDSYITNNGGVNWYKGKINSSGHGGIAFSDNKRNAIYTSVNQLPVFWKTDNGGISWGNQNFISSVSGENYPVWISGTNTIFFNTLYEIYRSDDGGNNWTRQYYDTSDAVLHIDYARYGNTIVGYAICFNGKILKTRQAVTTDINQISESIPENYSLHQNYPNPFNPKTTIKFDVYKKGKVRLTVFDIKGQLINVLVDNVLKEGTYEFNFNGNDLPSGTYFYRISANNFSESKKMILLK